MPHRPFRHLRSLAIGLILLALSAGVVFADQPQPRVDGRSVGSEAAGKTVPVAGKPSSQDDKGNPKSQHGPGDDADNEHCATDPRGLTEAQLGELTHGQIVCWAAHQETPDGYANHGAWVSEWARKGKDRPAPNGNANGLEHRP